MGVPIAALGALAAAAGTGAQVQAARKTQQAQNAAVNAELARQQSYREQGKKAFDTSLAQSSQPVAQQQVDAGTATRQAAMDRATAIPLATSQAAPIAQQGVDVVTPSLQRSSAAAAALQGYSEWDLQQWIKNLRAQENLRILTQFAHGSVDVLPYELQDAVRSHQTLSNAGMMLQALGGVAGSWGGMGSNPTAMSASRALDSVPSELQLATKNAPATRQNKTGYGYE